MQTNPENISYEAVNEEVCGSNDRNLVLNDNISNSNKDGKSFVGLILSIRSTKHLRSRKKAKVEKRQTAKILHRT